MLVDVSDPAVPPDVERPARRERLIGIDHAVGSRHGPRWIAQKRVVDTERLRECLIRLSSVDTDRKVRNVKTPDLIPTLTE